MKPPPSNLRRPLALTPKLSLPPACCPLAMCLSCQRRPPGPRTGWLRTARRPGCCLWATRPPSLAGRCVMAQGRLCGRVCSARMARRPGCCLWATRPPSPAGRCVMAQGRLCGRVCSARMARRPGCCLWATRPPSPAGRRILSAQGALLVCLGYPAPLTSWEVRGSQPDAVLIKEERLSTAPYALSACILQ